MDHVKLFAKNEKEQETLIQTVRMHKQDIGMEFGFEKCAMLIMKGVEKRDNERNRIAKSEKHQNTWSERKLQVLGDIRGGLHPFEMKEKIRKEWLRRTRKFLKTKLCGKNLF